MTTLSVIIPCFNEATTIGECVRRVRAIASKKLKLQIIIVDDASTDDSLAVVLALQPKHKEIFVIREGVNRGKGAAVREGFRMATGDFVAIQDADLESDPEDLKRLIMPLVEDRADVVFGSRFLDSHPREGYYYWHSLGNRFLTSLSNIFTGLHITDMETGYKVFKRDVIQRLDLRENRFGFEPEVTAKIAHLRVIEMPISYSPRTYREGKKIRPRDAFRALYCIVRYH